MCSSPAAAARTAPPAPSQRARVLVVEPHGEKRAVMEEALADAGYEVLAFPDGKSFDRLVKEFIPDAAVISVLQEPGRPCGYTMTRALRLISTAPILLILSEKDPPEWRLLALKAGGDQLMAEPFTDAELVARVSALLRRSRVGTAHLEVGDLILDEPARVATRNGTPLDLTPREFDVLLALARNPGRVLSKQRLAQVTGGAGTATSLPVHVSALRSKLEAVGPRVLETARGVGYVLRV